MVSQRRVSDTTADATEIYVAAYTSLSGADRVERSMEMAEEVKQVTLAGITHRNPEFSAHQVHREWLRILHGEAIASLIS